MRHPISLRLLTITLVFLGPVGRSEAAAPLSPAPAVSNPQMTATLMRLPLQFEANQGQVDEHVTFLARGTGYRLFLTPSESVLVLQQRESTTEPAQRGRGEPIARSEPLAIKQAVVRMKLEGANSTPAVEGKEHLPGIVNYFIGNDPATWRTHIPTYAKVQYHEAYPGIDLAYYGNQSTVEYDFIVAPGADPDQIRLAFEGASAMHLADSGDLLLATDLGDVRVQKPLVYQLDPEGHKTLVAGHYGLESTARPRPASHPESPVVGIHLAAYDRSKPLVIDPALLYSTYLGGSSGDGGNGIAVDGTGQAYVTGNTGSTNFPTATPLQATLADSGDVFVTKLNAAGTALRYSTYLGGGDLDAGNGIAVDGAGQAYVTGYTWSGD
ncbi:MAG TPA: SBBP repeat-containing protein, partial [Nitrospira sp.]|nr:SBBP repeat-containing protein [Nitrospira sp.]